MNRRTLRWILPALILIVVPAVAPVVHAKDKDKGKSAKALYKAGQAAETRDDYLAAYDDYAAAFAKEPGNLYYKTSYQRLRFTAAAVHTHQGEKLRDQGDNAGALTEFVRALEIDPANELAQQDIRQTKEKIAATPNNESSLPSDREQPMGDISAPAELKAVSNEPITIHAFEDSKVVYQTVGKIAGINVLFDPDYTGKRIQVDLQNVSLLDALHIVGVVSNTFWRPITSNTVFVAQNTRAKRTELDSQAVQTFYLSNASQQNDLNDVQTALRNVIQGAKLYAVPSQNAIVMRATPDELLLARKLVDDLDKSRPEAVVDVAVLEVNRNKERNLGIILPQTFTAALQGSTTTTTTTPTTNADGSTTTNTTGNNTNGGLTLNSLGNLNANNVAVTIGQATANLLLTDSDTRVLQNPRIRATDGQKADLKVGSKIPIATGSFQTGAATAVVSSLVNTQFQYQDVGVEIEITPAIHYNRDVTLKLKMAITQLNGYQSLSGIQQPIFSQRTIEQTIRLREGEASILGGLLQQNQSNTFSGTPGLAQIPLLKYLFSNNDKINMQDEIVFMLIPHVVRGELSPLNLREIDTGTGNSISLRRIATIRVPADAVAPPAGQPGAALPSANPAPGTPGTTTGAAPATAQGLQQGAQQAMQQAAANSTAAPVSLSLAAPGVAPKIGSNFQLAVNLSGGADVFSVPMQVQYDPAKLTLINVDSGAYLGRDGQTVALVHRDDGAGGVAISASRPPGVAGVNGAGQLCVLTFQAKTAGDSIVSVTKAAARDSKQQALPVITSGTIVHVQ